MAGKTKFLTNNPATRKKWSKDLFISTLPNVEFNTLVGTSENSPIQMKTDLGKGEGDEVKFDIFLDLDSDPVVGRDTVEGTEEAIKSAQFKMNIEEVNKAVDTGGAMEEQRIPYNLFDKGKSLLNRWWGQFLSDTIINYAVGNSSYKISGQIFAQAATEPDIHHIVLPGSVGTVGDPLATREASITQSNIVDLRTLDRMKQLARLPVGGGFKVRPVSVKGKDYYRVLLHDYAFDMLRLNTNVGQWGDLLRAAQKLGDPYTEIVYNGMMISKTERIPKMMDVSGAPAGSGVYRACLMGAQSMTWAWGGAGESKSTVMNFHPYKKDAGRFVMIRGGGIFGVKKVVFDNTGSDQDYGMITTSGYAEPTQP